MPASCHPPLLVFLACVACSDTEIEEMIKEADKDGDGAINQDEFIRLMRYKSANPLDIDSDGD